VNTKLISKSHIIYRPAHKRSGFFTDTQIKHSIPKRKHRFFSNNVIVLFISSIPNVFFYARGLAQVIFLFPFYILITFSTNDLLSSSYHPVCLLPSFQFLIHTNEKSLTISQYPVVSYDRHQAHQTASLLPIFLCRSSD